MARYRAVMQEVYSYMAEFDADDDSDAIEKAWDANYGVPLSSEREDYLDDRDVIHVERILE